MFFKRKKSKLPPLPDPLSDPETGPVTDLPPAEGEVLDTGEGSISTMFLTGDSGRDRSRVELLLGAIAGVSESRDLEPLLCDIVDRSIEVTGAERVVPIFDSDEAAGEAMLEGFEPAPKSADEALAEDESSIMFSPVDEDRVGHFIQREETITNPVHGHAFGTSWRGIGRMSGLDADGVRFTWGGGTTGLTSFEMAQFLSLGTDLKVKFRLPLLKKGMSEAVVTVTDIEERPDGVKIGASFSEIDDETRQSVQQYAEDLRFLRQELDTATED